MDPSRARPRILISEPNAAGEEYAFLPYVWGVLKSYWEHHGAQPDAFEWLDPLFCRSTIAGDLERNSAAPPDVLGLSCYTWNWDLQLHIARWAKEHNPRCLVVAGGPDPDYKDPDFFRKYPDIDIVVVKDGEIPFTRILETVLAGERHVGHVPGLYLPRNGATDAGQADGPHIFTGAAVTPAVFEHSPYLDQRDFYERLRTTHGVGKLNATWETNRGCPYACSFCDWGSATMSKVRQFSMSRVEAEADWLGAMQLNFIFLADANFGILPRDTEIADLLAAARAKHAHPKFIYYSSAKNNPSRTVDIARRFYSARLTALHVLSVQHTDPAVLEATDRSNIPAAKYREVVHSLLEQGIPSQVQLIIGIPGDSPERWKRCLGEIMDWGVHDNYTVFPYSLLPNAPAAERSFVERWGIESIDRWLVDPIVRRAKTSLTGFVKSRVVVSSRTYTREDWVDMSTHTAFVKALHNRSLTRLPAMYLHFAHGVSYREFYGAVVDEFCRTDASTADTYGRIQQHFQEFLDNPEGSDELVIDDVPGYSFYTDASRWVFINICRRVDDFYERLGQFLSTRFPAAAHLSDAVEYQRRMVILPDYDVMTGAEFYINRDWPAFFHRTARLTQYEPLGEPAMLDAPRLVEIRARTCGGGASLNFGDSSGGDRWARWIEQTVRFANAATWSNFSPPPPLEDGTMQTAKGAAS
jgi:putative methyltransferase